MLTWIGATMIVLTTALTGMYLLWQQKRRAEELGASKRALNLLKNQISFLAVPLDEAMASSAFHAEGTIGAVFQEVSHALTEGMGSAEELWTSAWLKRKGESTFSAEDMQAFLSYGKILGYLDKEQQRSGIDLLLYYLEEAEKEQRERIQKQGRLYHSVGIMSGLLIVMILL